MVYVLFVILHNFESVTTYIYIYIFGKPISEKEVIILKVHEFYYFSVTALIIP